MEKIGLQLYSIKELAERNFLGTLKKVADIGYDGVEFAGYFNTPAREIKKVLDDSGIRAAGSHLGLEAILEDVGGTIAFSKELESPYIVVPYLAPKYRDSADAWKHTADTFNELGTKLKENGLQLYYHNHDFEFEKFDGEFGLDILVNHTEPDNLHIELDTFWVEYMGLKSVDFMKKYGKRCSILHIKDMKSETEKINTIIGRGVMNFPAITALGKKLGVEWYTIEQEEFETDLLFAVNEGYRYLSGIL
jgi:sugar phosphate isomerase/epimerase